MPIQRSRFHNAIQQPPPQQSRSEIVEPIQGLNRQRPATNLRPGETPFSQNWVMGDRYIEPRSGISSWGSNGAAASQGSTGITGSVLGYFNAPRSDRSEYAYVTSSSTIRAYDLAATPVAAWVPQLSGVAFSARTSDYYFGVVAFDPTSSSTTGNSALYLTNWVQPPRVVNVGQANLTPVSNLTELYSLASYARYVTAHDDRLIFFHTSGSTNTGTDLSLLRPTRVIGSARGDAKAFSSGFFEDLTMAGVGTGAIPERDRLVLLSSKEVWEGRPRRDAYAYDFFALNKSRGCPIEYDRTPRNTDIGTIWLGDGNQFQRLIGTEVRSLGDKVRDLLTDEMREGRHAFSIFNPASRLYACFYSDTTGEYPTRALFLRTDTVSPSGSGSDDGTWFLQDFGSYQFCAGGVYGSDTVLISSAGTAYRMLSTQTTDAGTAIDCRWRSHALRAQKDIYPFEALQEVWLEYEYDGTQSSTISLFQSTNNGASFTAIASSSMTSGTGYNFIPVSAAAGRNQMFEWRLNDGSRPRLGRFTLTLRGYSGRHTGSL